MAASKAATITIVGVDGSRWVVSGPGSGEQGVLLDVDPDGLHDEAPIKTLWSQSSYEEGATYDGYNIEPIDLVLTFVVFGDSTVGRTWRQTDSAFRQAFSNEVEAVIEFEDPEAVEFAVRTLSVRPFSSMATRSKHDPRLGQYARSTVTLRAGVPFWKSGERFSTFSTDSASASGSVEISNPTDRPLWLRWALTAPGQWVLPDWNFKGGLHAKRTIEIPKLSTGQDMTIDTYPLRESYVSVDGHNIAGRFGGVEFLHPVPPHTPPTMIPVKLTGGSGTNIVQVRMVDYWKMPYGGEQ